MGVSPAPGTAVMQPTPQGACPGTRRQRQTEGCSMMMSETRLPAV